MAVWEEKKVKKKIVPTKHAILMAGIQEEKRQAQLKEAYGITEEVTVVEKKSRTAQLLVHRAAPRVPGTSQLR